MSVLLDVNVLVALLNPAHRFRSVAHDWFGAVKDSRATDGHHSDARRR